MKEYPDQILCNDCGEVKPKEEFRFIPSGRWKGYISAYRCKNCWKLVDRKHERRHRRKHIEKYRERERRNNAKRKEYRRAYYKAYHVEESILLKDNYIKGLIMSYWKYHNIKGKTRADITEAMIEAKRKEIQIKRGEVPIS